MDQTAKELEIISHFNVSESRLLDTGQALFPLRKKAIDLFATKGFPTKKDEEWRYTDISPLSNTAVRFQSGPCGLPSKNALTLTDGMRLEIVLFNGIPCPTLLRTPGLEQGVILQGLKEALKNNSAKALPHIGRFESFRENVFTHLNTGFFLDGAFIYVPKGVKIKEPISILHVSDSSNATSNEIATTSARVLIVLEEGASAEVVESFVGDQARSYFTNSVTEISLAKKASLSYVKVQIESAAAFHIGNIKVYQEEESDLTSTAFSLGASLSRTDINVLLNAERCSASLFGLYLGSKEQLVDNHTTIDHAKPNCKSWEIYKGILSGKSKAVFNGKILVRKDAQKTDAKQTSKNLLLSKDAEVNAKPELQIFADDVKCTHGATVGQLDEQSLFYLRSRGIPESEAKAMLTVAFAEDVLLTVKSELIKNTIRNLLNDALKKLG